MKKFFILLIGAACFCVIVVSCNKQNGVEVAPTQEKEPISVIDLMEKEEGIKYFKKDVVLRDASGKNKIVMRFAAVDEDALNYYLSVREHTVIPNPKTSKGLGKTKVDFTDNQIQNIDSEIGASKIRVVSEVSSSQLDNGVVRYGIKVTTKNFSNTRLSQNYNFWETHICPTNWPETLTMTVYGTNDQCYPKLTWGLDYRTNWTATWYSLNNKPWDNYLLTGYPPNFFIPCTNTGGGNQSTSTFVQDVDGPWRVRFNAQWNQEYSFVWFNDSN